MNHDDVNLKLYLQEAKDVLELLNELDIDLLPRNLKHSCGHLIHSLKIRIQDIESYCDGEKDITEIEKLNLQLFGTANLMNKAFIEPLKKFIEDETSD